MMCQACEVGRHEDCGLQTWCECDCDPESEWMAGIFSPDKDMPHSDTCTCETCIQNYPERDEWPDDDPLDELFAESELSNDEMDEGTAEQVGN